MKTTIGKITLGEKEYDATEIDYDSYDYLTGTIEVGEKEFSSVMSFGEESEEEEEESV